MASQAFLRYLKAGRLSANRAVVLFEEILSENPNFRRLAPRDHAMCIELLWRLIESKKQVQVFVSRTQWSDMAREQRRTGSMPPARCAIIGLDWVGFLNSCTGILQELGINIFYSQGFVLHFRGTDYGVVFIEIEIREVESRDRLRNFQNYLTEHLARAAVIDTGRSALLKEGARKLDLFATISDIIKERYLEAREELLGEDGEAVKFFYARSELYIRERRSEDIARLIYNNWRFRQEAQARPDTVMCEVANLPFKEKETLTGITVAAHASQFLLVDCLRVIGEVVPGFIRHHDKGFLTDGGIGVYRIEITKEDGSALKEVERRELEERILSGRIDKTGQKVSPGVELIQRKIVPAMLEEEKLCRIPMVYMHPHRRDHIKVVLVTSDEDRGYAVSCAAAIDREKGVTAAAAELPSHLTHGEGEAEVVQEVSIIDVWVDFEKIDFGPRIVSAEEEVLNRIEESIKTADRIGSLLRIFDMGSRFLRRQRLEHLLNAARKRRMNLELVRDLFYRIGDKVILDARIPDAEILAIIQTGLRAGKDFVTAEGKAIKVRAITPKDRSAPIWFAIAHSVDKNILQVIIDSLEEFTIESFTQLDTEEFQLVLMRVAPGDEKSMTSAVRRARERIRHITV